ncbi:hypothetical protein HanPI659440_Chr04g0177111 [Helianthus annuus]|nr:hypothetical protein HanPI659440_Chr04g0177111 [Helianthus annuus]
MTTNEIGESDDKRETRQGRSKGILRKKITGDEREKRKVTFSADVKKTDANPTHIRKRKHNDDKEDNEPIVSMIRKSQIRKRKSNVNNKDVENAKNTTTVEQPSKDTYG